MSDQKVDLIHEEGYEQAWRFRCKFNWQVAKNQNYAQTWSPCEPNYMCFYESTFSGRKTNENIPFNKKVTKRPEMKGLLER